MDIALIPGAALIIKFDDEVVHEDSVEPRYASSSKTIDVLLAQVTAMGEADKKIQAVLGRPTESYADGPKASRKEGKKRSWARTRYSPATPSLRHVCTRQSMGPAKRTWASSTWDWSRTLVRSKGCSNTLETIPATWTASESQRKEKTSEHRQVHTLPNATSFSPSTNAASRASSEVASMSQSGVREEGEKERGL